MMLVIGAQASGKRDYVMSLGYSENEMADAVMDDRPVLYNLQDLIALSPNVNVQTLLCKEVIICNEVGCGVIPISREEREAREATGRTCIMLAKEADSVVRLICGIPTVLKGEPKCR